MKINKKVQYALLFTWYLTRAGKANVKDAAINLGLNQTELRLAAKTLVKKGVLKESAEKSGAYELASNPTVKDVLEAFGSVSCLTSKETSAYKLGATESRTLAYFSKVLDSVISAYLNKTMRSIGNDLVIAEVNYMETATPEVSN